SCCDDDFLNQISCGVVLVIGRAVGEDLIVGTRNVVARRRADAVTVVVVFVRFARRTGSRRKLAIGVVGISGRLPVVGLFDGLTGRIVKICVLSDNGVCRVHVFKLCNASGGVVHVCGTANKVRAGDVAVAVNSDKLPAIAVR